MDGPADFGGAVWKAKLSVDFWHYVENITVVLFSEVFDKALGNSLLYS